MFMIIRTYIISLHFLLVHVGVLFLIFLIFIAYHAVRNKRFF